MRVLQVIDTLNIGGAERMLVTLTNLLLKQGITTDVLLINNTGPLEDEINRAAAIYKLNRRSKYSIGKLYKANRICSNYDIVHVHMRHCYTYIRLAQILFRGRYKIVLHDHYGDIEINAKVPASLKGIFKPHYYIGVSPALIQWAKNTLKLSVDKCFLLQNSIDIITMPAEHQLPKNGKVMLVSNLRATKNLEFAIELLGNNLTIYGNKQNEEYFKHIQNICANKGANIEQGIRNIGHEYYKYDMAVHTSRSETGPLVLLEYMAAGMPFLAYKTGAVAALVADELPVYFIDNFDKEQWAQRIAAISSIQDHSVLQKTFNRCFSSQRYINTCLDIYQCVSS